MAAITEPLCGCAEETAQVSAAAAQRDTAVEAWHTRTLATCPYLLLDARYEKVWQDGQGSDAAVLVAMGLTHDSIRQVLGVSVAVSEQEVY